MHHVLVAVSLCACLLTMYMLQPLKPKEGRFLPAAAAIGGLLFLAPEGHLPTEHDVIRLDVSLKSLGQQQGYIRCCNKPNVSILDCWSTKH